MFSAVVVFRRDGHLNGVLQDTSCDLADGRRHGSEKQRSPVFYSGYSKGIRSLFVEAHHGSISSASSSTR